MNGPHLHDVVGEVYGIFEARLELYILVGLLEKIVNVDAETFAHALRLIRQLPLVQIREYELGDLRSLIGSYLVAGEHSLLRGHILVEQVGALGIADAALAAIVADTGISSALMGRKEPESARSLLRTVLCTCSHVNVQSHKL